MITAQPQSATQPPGTPVTLRVEATGPNLAYQWKRDGADIAGATGATLDVPNPAGAIARYSVTVRNGGGSVDSAEVTVAAEVPLQKLSLVAGGLGGFGLLEGRGRQTRLPLIQVAREIVATPAGTVYFLSGSYLARVKPQGDLEFFPLSSPTAEILGLVVSGTTVYCFERYAIRRLVEAETPSYELVAGAEGFAPGLVDGTGGAVRVNEPRYPVLGADGMIYFVDNFATVRRLSAGGAVVTIAGNPANRKETDGQGTAAGFGYMKGLVAMPNGDLLVLDSTLWRRVTPAGLVTTLPGSVSTQVSGPIPADATSVFAKLGNSVIRLGLDGSVTTVAGNQTQEGYVEGPASAALFGFYYTPELRTMGRLPTGELLVEDSKNNVLRTIDLAASRTAHWLGAPAQSATVDGQGDAARFYGPRAIALDAAGNAYVLEQTKIISAGVFKAALRKVTPDGVASTVHPDFPPDGGLAIDAAGNFYGARGRALVKVTPAGAETVVAGKADAEPGFADGPAAQARFATLAALAFDRQGNLFVGDAPYRTGFDGIFTFTYGNTIRKITPDGQVSTFSGVPGNVLRSVADPGLWIPSDLATDAAGNVYVLQRGKDIRRIGPQGGAAEVLVSAAGLQTMAVTAAGTLYYHAEREEGYAQTIRRRLPDGTSQRIAGGELVNAAGVRTGPLPGAVNRSAGMIAAPDASLFLLSENSLLKIGPA